MSQDARDVIDVLKFELSFIKAGGYGRSVRTPWLPTSMFQDSVTCLNFGDPNRTIPCNHCLMMQFVPPERRSEAVPCRHIPLNEAGETVQTLIERDDQERLEEAVENWLRKAIQRLEEERAQKVVR